MERNLQEQVLYLTNELNKIKQSLGTALPDPIPGSQGEQGIQGEPGIQGEQGFGIVGFGTQLPSSGRDGDWFLLKKSTMSGIDFVMCRCVSQHWVEQFSIRGPAGPIANANEVVANPSQDATGGDLNTVEIDGVVYSVIDAMNGKYVKVMNAPASTTLTSAEKNEIINGCFINGEFLGYKNPVFFPAKELYGVYYGLVIGNTSSGQTKINEYAILSNNEITNSYIKKIDLHSVNELNGVQLPSYPTNPTRDKVLVYKTTNEMEWENRKNLYRHNIKLSFTADYYVYFTLYSRNGAPITDISEVLELKYQAIGSTCVLSDNQENFAGIIITFENSDLSIDIGGGLTHLDYNDDLIDVEDDNSEVL